VSALRGKLRSSCVIKARTNLGVESKKRPEGLARLLVKSPARETGGHATSVVAHTRKSLAR